MNKQRKTVTRCQRGVVLVWTLFLMMVLLGMTGLALDYARVRLVKLQLQHAADAAALGGASRIRVDTLDEARLRAQGAAAYNSADGSPVMLNLNFGNGSDGDIVFGRYDRGGGIFQPGEEGADAVQVRTHRPDSGTGAVPLMFGPIFGVADAALHRRAIAMNLLTSGAAILVLNEAPGPTMTTQGNTTLNVINGSVQINSPHDNSIRNQSMAVNVNVSDVNACGYPPLPGQWHVDGNYNHNAPRMPDPLAHLQDETFADLIANPLTVPANKVLPPGYYPTGVTMHNGSMTLTGGVYVFGGSGLTINGGNFTAEGVMIHVIGGQIKLNGNGNIRITPMTSGPYANVSLFQDEALHTQALINGTSGAVIDGTIYIPGAELSCKGNEDMHVNQIIADKLEVTGNSDITVDYQGTFGRLGRVFLVE